MLTYPNINPVAVSLGVFKIHWYGLMYLIGFVSAWILGVWRAKKSWQPAFRNAECVSDGLFYGALGVILGGRIGYVLFYNLAYYFQHPIEIFYLWDGGMSFHGGLLGVLVAAYLLARKHDFYFFDVTDFYAPLVPIGLAAGRIGNFINGELFGRVIQSPKLASWVGMIYPEGGSLPRYPSEIFEFLGEGVLLFLILWIYSRNPRPRMAVSGLFLIGYGLIRFSLEFFRQPDAQLGFIGFGWMTMGQLLCLPMLILGLVIMCFAYFFKRG